MKRSEIEDGSTVYNNWTARLGSPVMSNPVGTVLSVTGDWATVRWDQGTGDGSVSQVSVKALFRIDGAGR